MKVSFHTELDEHINILVRVDMDLEENPDEARKQWLRLYNDSRDRVAFLKQTNSSLSHTQLKRVARLILDHFDQFEYFDFQSRTFLFLLHDDSYSLERDLKNLSGPLTVITDSLLIDGIWRDIIKLMI